MKQNKVYIYGKHVLMEALANNPSAIEQVFLSGDNEDKELRDALRKAGIKISALGSDKSSKKIQDTESHQGVIGKISLDKLVVSYEDFIKDFKIGQDTVFVLLGEVQDPHNVGAIIRSAAAFGISGILIPKHNQAPITDTVIKVSSGMVFSVPIISIGNVNGAIEDLKKKGFWIYGLDGEAKESILDEEYNSPTVFVLGNESTGIRQRTAELCDKLLSIPTHSKCESLNVSSSAAVTLFAWSIKHSGALK